MSFRARALGALSAAALLIPASGIVFATGAQAAPGGGYDSEQNQPAYWENKYPGLECKVVAGKVDVYTTDKDYALVVIKASTLNEEHKNVPAGTPFEGIKRDGKPGKGEYFGISHVIACTGPTAPGGDDTPGDDHHNPPPTCDEDSDTPDLPSCTGDDHHNPPPTCDEDSDTPDLPSCTGDEPQKPQPQEPQKPEPQKPQPQEPQKPEPQKPQPQEPQEPNKPTTPTCTTTPKAPGCTNPTTPNKPVTPKAPATKPAPKAPVAKAPAAKAPAKAAPVPPLAQTGMGDTVAGLATALTMIGAGAGLIAFSRRRNF